MPTSRDTRQAPKVLSSYAILLGPSPGSIHPLPTDPAVTAVAVSIAPRSLSFQRVQIPVECVRAAAPPVFARPYFSTLMGHLRVESSSAARFRFMNFYRCPRCSWVTVTRSSCFSWTLAPLAGNNAVDSKLQCFKGRLDGLGYLRS